MDDGAPKAIATGAFQSPTFGKDGSFTVNEAVGSASISPCGRDIVLASRQGLHIIDLDNPYSPPRYLPHHTPWEVADVQWSPFASRDAWVVSTSNQKALLWNLETSSPHGPIQHVLHAHSRAITDINFSAHNPDYLATCAVDSFVHCWDLRDDQRPAITFADWFAGATQVKWNRQDPHIIASSHDKHLHVWDNRKGAHPLKTINAHATKIYGIDWNRVSSTNLLTCSLDKTIKFWNYGKPENEPERIIQTDYPIWRARHTPFGNGVLAMPQRGNYDLHLYSFGPDDNIETDKTTEPCHLFPGHQNSVKEFLWRTRGGLQDDNDMREFQLVSWSNDKTLLLHKVDDEMMKKVGYNRGDKVDQRINFTRKNARYKTFKDEAKTATDSAVSMVTPMLGLGSLLRDRRRSSIATRSTSGPKWKHSEQAGGRSIMQVRKVGKNGDNPIAWMKGVKISKGETEATSGRDSAQRLTSSGAPPWETPESLGDEITHVGDKYKNVSFENVDVPGRSITIAFNGPWGSDDNLVHTRVSIKFPDDYPEISAPIFSVEKRSSISDVTQSKLALGLQTIAEGYVNLGRGSLEAILCYLLGEQDLEESSAWVANEQSLLNSGTLHRADESSSDEEDGPMKTFVSLPPTDLDASENDLGATTNMNANVPLPKACGALWAENGQLICFFPQRESTETTISAINIEGSDKTLRTRENFEGFGRLSVDTSGNRNTTTLVAISDGSESSDDASSSSSSHLSSSASDSDEAFPSRFQLHPAWRNHFTSNQTRSLDRSLKSSAPTTMKHNVSNSKTFISIHELDDLLPAKRRLAEEYMVFGDGPKVCAHNSEVAAKHDFDHLADIWGLVKLILCNDIPLEIMPQSHRRDDILVLAKRSLVQIKRRDSGLDLAFDEPEAITSSKFKGRVKWGQHPLGAWLIKLIFEYFEQLADVQMLAMLSCVLGEPPISQAIPEVQFGDRRHDIFPLGKIPAFSLSYYPSADVAWSMFQSDRSGAPSIKERPQALEAYGSYASSEGVWGSDADNEQAISRSVGTTPPSMSRQYSRTSDGSHNNVDASPEHSIKRSYSTASNAFSVSLTRPFSSFMASTSPPSRKASKGQAEFSTSAPSSGGITWGRNKIYDDTSVPQMSRSRPVATFEPEDSDSDDDVPTTDDFDVHVSLKNQNMFDDEGCVSLPLLQPDHSVRHKLYRAAYANILYSWSMPFAACEILKFNGITSAAIPPGITSFGRNETSTQEGLKVPSTTPYPSVRPVLHCSNCNAAIDNSGKQPRPEQLPKFRTQLSTPLSSLHCSACGSFARRPTCIICFTSLTGLYKTCLRCGHCSHTSCLHEYLADACDVDASSLNEVDSHRDVPCEAGCGCICSDADILVNAASPSVDSVVPTIRIPENGFSELTDDTAGIYDHGSAAFGDDESGWNKVTSTGYGMLDASRKVSNVSAAVGGGGPDMPDVFSWSRAALMLQKYQLRGST